MKKLFLSILLIACLPALASDLVAKGQNSRLELSQKPCAEEILALIPPLMRDDFRGGTGTLHGESQPVCWTDYDRESYLVVFADGTGAAFKKRIFKLEEGV